LAAALGKLILEPELRRGLAERAATFARDTFSMEINARRNESLYRTLLARKGIIAPKGGAQTGPVLRFAR
jgi:hypothetical protein